MRVRVEGQHRSFLRGRVEELIAAGPKRTDPACAVFGSCGGCAWQHIAYDAQLEAKAKIASDALARIGRVGPRLSLPITPSPAAYGYRSRARVLAHGGRVGFRRRRSHALCPTGRCPVLAPPLQAKLAELSAHPPADGEWELFCGVPGGEARAAALPPRDTRPAELLVAGEHLAISPGVFVQSNGLLHDALVNAVLAAAGEGDLACDFFAGAGFFTLGLARRFARVVAVEASPDAARDLARNLRSAGIENAVLHSEPLEAAFERGAFEGLEPDVVVVDPPRTGLPPGSCTALAELAPRRIAYLACDPATQARDVSYLVGSGYALEWAAAFDLFPQTPHVEVLAVLERVG